MPPNNPAIELRSVIKRFGAHTVIDDVSLTVGQAEVTAIIGPSGAGKSTLLRCINLLERPDSGQIAVVGTTIDARQEINAKDLAKLRSVVGMVFQSFNLFPAPNGAAQHHPSPGRSSWSRPDGIQGAGTCALGAGRSGR